jgi:hypothetical protein
MSSGIYVWLMQEARVWWPDLVQQAERKPTPERYVWLLAELKKDPLGVPLVREYVERRKADARERAQRDRKRMLAHYKQQLKEHPGNDYYQKKIARLEKEIEKADWSEREAKE